MTWRRVWGLFPCFFYKTLTPMGSVPDSELVKFSESTDTSEATMKVNQLPCITIRTKTIYPQCLAITLIRFLNLSSKILWAESDVTAD